MALKRVTVYCMEIEDKPGSLHRFLSLSSLSGVDYLCFTACSCSNNRSRVAVSPKEPKKFEAFVQEGGIEVSLKTGFIFDGKDHIGAAADAIKALAENYIAGIAGAGMVIDGRFQMFVVVDPSDADRAQKSLGA
jgi:hypothetical protein